MFERDRGHLQWHYGELASHTNLRPVKLGLRSASLHKARDKGLTQGATFLQFPFPSSLRNIRLCATINPGHSHPRMPCEVGVVLLRSAPCLRISAFPNEFIVHPSFFVPAVGSVASSSRTVSSGVWSFSLLTDCGFSLNGGPERYSIKSSD